MRTREMKMFVNTLFLQSFGLCLNEKQPEKKVGFAIKRSDEKHKVVMSSDSSDYSETQKSERSQSIESAESFDSNSLKTLVSSQSSDNSAKRLELEFDQE